MGYEGKKAVITGGSTGIGFATARLFSSQGGQTIITGRDAEALKAAKLELGKDVTAVRSDTSSLREIEQLAEQVKSFGPIDLLFVNAGIASFTPFAEVTEDFYDRMFGINLKGAFFTVQKLAPYVKDGGAIVLNTSVVDEKGFAGASVYSSTKAGLRSLARTLSTELLPRGIRVNAVSPGPIATPILGKGGLSKVESDAMLENFAATNPMKRVGQPDEVGRAVMFLAFDATYTTGAELTVDGGLVHI